MEPISTPATNGSSATGMGKPNHIRAGALSWEGQDLSFMDWLSELGAEEPATAGASAPLQAMARITAEEALQLLSVANASKLSAPDSLVSPTSQPNTTADTNWCQTSNFKESSPLDWVFDLLHDPNWIQQLQVIPQANGAFMLLFPSLQAAGSFFGGSGDSSYRNMAVSQGLEKLLEAAQKSAKPIRIALDDQSAVILKIRQGKVSAEFLSSDPQVALQLANHIHSLRQRLMDKGLPVEQLDYTLLNKPFNQDSQQQQESDQSSQHATEQDPRGLV
jgi:hypothetical protein